MYLLSEQINPPFRRCMLRRLQLLLVISVFFITSALFAEQPTAIIGHQIIDFSLEDPYRNIYSTEKLQGICVIFILGSRKVHKEQLRWATHLQDQFGEKEEIQILSVLPIRVPSYISRDSIYARVREENYPVTILLDWEQSLFRALDAPEDRVSISLLNTQGVLIHYQEGDYSDTSYDLLNDQITNTINPNKTSDVSE